LGDECAEALALITDEARQVLLTFWIRGADPQPRRRDFDAGGTDKRHNGEFPAIPRAKAEMTRPTTSTDPVVEALATRLLRIDLVGWQRIAAWAEKVELSFEDLRLLLALKLEGGPTGVSELADLGGLSLDAAYPAVHSLRGRGYLREERRQYSLSEQGQELVATLDVTHREGIQAYVDQLDPHEHRRLDEALGTAQ
jgi:DNA-binding MarR family transcriptional regulator